MIDINWYFVYAYLLVVSFAAALYLTGVMRRLALRWQVLDHPGERKVHAAPVPLLGGAAIVLTFVTVVVVHLLLLWPVARLNHEWFQRDIIGFLGQERGVLARLAGLMAGGLLLFAVGVFDDLRALSPEIKLVFQLIAAAVVVLSGIRINLFLPYPWLSASLTMFWIVMMVNALNFLDNMDGLCAGVSVIAAFTMFLCMLHHGHTFVSVMLLVFAGAAAGFLYHNLAPAKIFMGDAGSMFCGYILAASSVMGTYYREGITPSRLAIAAPVLALSVPIFDTLSVVFIRWQNGESIMKGDKRHFSHRLVNLGMTKGQAVEFIYLVGAIAGLGAVLLPKVSFWGGVIVIVQVAGTFSLIVLLMNAGKKQQGPLA